MLHFVASDSHILTSTLERRSPVESFCTKAYYESSGILVFKKLRNKAAIFLSRILVKQLERCRVQLVYEGEIVEVQLSRKLVGAPGFEPGTSRTPSVRATRLRYAPTYLARLSPPFKKGQESAQRIAHIQQHFAVQKLRRAIPRTNRRTRFGIRSRSAAFAQMPPRSRNRKSFVVKQPLDSQNQVNIFLPVKSPSVCSLLRLQHREFRLPIPQHKRFHARHPANFADAIEPALQIQ